ncbi:MAG: thiolase family protein [Ignavibacteriales bacterium]|nr:thiolase family protein [Ignavibacteriales bacterium]
MRKVVITSAKRTPIGSFLGSLAKFNAPQLGSLVIKSILAETGISKNLIDEIILGNVLTAGLGQAPARQAALLAGLPDSVECLTINKMCGSGLKAVMLAHQAIALGDANIIIAGGQESMSNAPYLIQKARNGLRLGHSDILDSLILDGLWDVYNNIHMGTCAETCASQFNFTRENLDKYAIESYQKAIEAQNNHKFKNEIVPIEIIQSGEKKFFAEDEEPKKVNFEKIPKLKPAFEKNGVLTAANSSKINDSAAALIIVSEDKALELGLTPLVEIVAYCSIAKNPIDFTTAPADAIRKVCNKAHLELSQIDLFEINEAFAVVSLAVNKILDLDPRKVNINGGAIALGHPIGASGARILVTLIHSLLANKLKYGLASLCIGGGEGIALIIKSYEKV